MLVCRFVAYKGEPLVASKLLHEPKNSLIRQSYECKERKEPLNGDGFGLGWYVKEVSNEPALFRSIQPAWSDTNLRAISEKTKTDCLFAHVRAATEGEISQQNCHPFQYGPLLMMHNGTIDEFSKVQRQLRNALHDEVYSWVRGQTDSEHLFAVFLSNVIEAELNLSAEDPGEFSRVLQYTISQIEEIKKLHGVETPSKLNLVVTNGHWLIASRYISNPSLDASSLYYSAGARYECIDGVCAMKGSSSQKKSVLVVSEKLTEITSDWTPVPVNHIIVVNNHMELSFSPLNY